MSLTSSSSSSSTTRTQLHYYTMFHLEYHTTTNMYQVGNLSAIYSIQPLVLIIVSPVRITPVAAIVSIFPFPLHKRKRLRSTFTSLINLLPFYMFNLLSLHVLNCTVMLYHLILFPFTCFLFQSLKSRGRSSLSKGSMLGTVVYASRPRKFIPLHTLAAPYTIVLFLILC